MNNNDILRRIRYTFSLGDKAMIDLFKLVDYEVSRNQVVEWLKRDTDPAYKAMDDTQLAAFLNGFIISRRGKKDGPPPVAEKRLDNNIVFRKLRIALNLKDENILEILLLAGRRISKHELSAFFRNPSQQQYRPCQDQILRNFLKGMQLKYHNKKTASEPDPISKPAS